MPWFPYAVRRRTENDPTTRDIWLAVRQVHNLAGGFGAELASIALSVNRADARTEHVVSELNLIVGRLEAALSALAELASLVDRGETR